MKYSKFTQTPSTRSYTAREGGNTNLKSGTTNWGRSGQPDVFIHLAWAGLPNYKSIHHFEGGLPSQ
jgi:hypothetical protein